jgi:hypothetical protein
MVSRDIGPTFDFFTEEEFTMEETVIWGEETVNQEGGVGECTFSHVSTLISIAYARILVR